MKIGIDCQYLLSKSPGGPEKYLENVISSLSQIDPENQYILYFKKEPSDFVANLTGGVQNFSFKVLTSKISWTQWSLARELVMNPVDAFFSSFHTLPILAALSPYKKSKTAWISMIHGVEYSFENKNVLKSFWLHVPLYITAKLSDFIVVPSAHTKEKLVKIFKISDKKVKVVPEGVYKRFRKRSSEEVLPVLKKYGLADSTYLLFVSTIQPRKNVPNLVSGFAEALKGGEIPRNTKLVLAGKLGWDYKESLDAPQESNVSENVYFLGRVPDSDLPYLFSGAAAYVSASLEEGFGLPLLEAMSSGIPCVVSDIPSYRQIAGDCVLYFDPKDISSISEGIVALFKKYEGDVSKAEKKAQNYTWTKTAENLLHLFNNKE